MADKRKKDVLWEIRTNPDGRTTPSDDAHLAVLMDIRDELKTISGILRCRSFLDIPHKLEAIRRNTVKKRKAKKP